MKLVESKRVTASVHSSLKSMSGNPSGEKLALRHCFVLEDPPDDGKTSSDTDRLVFLLLALVSRYCIDLESYCKFSYADLLMDQLIQKIRKMRMTVLKCRKRKS